MITITRSWRGRLYGNHPVNKFLFPLNNDVSGGRDTRTDERDPSYGENTLLKAINARYTSGIMERTAYHERLIIFKLENDIFVSKMA